MKEEVHVTTTWVRDGSKFVDKVKEETRRRGALARSISCPLPPTKLSNPARVRKSTSMK